MDADLPDFEAQLKQEEKKTGEGAATNIDPHNEEIGVDELARLSFQNQQLVFQGGVTKCALTMMRMLERDAALASLFAGKRVLEVGSGTGMVGTALAILGARVDMTDQAYVVELLAHNAGQNLTPVQRARVRCFELLWGPACAVGLGAAHPDAAAGAASADGADNGGNGDGDGNSRGGGAGRPGSLGAPSAPYQAIFAADLIYAREAHIPLLQSFRALGTPATDVYLAYIHRFPWERRFFQLMDTLYTRHLLLLEDGIWLYRFTPRADAVFGGGDVSDLLAAVGQSGGGTSGGGVGGADGAGGTGDGSDGVGSAR